MAFQVDRFSYLSLAKLVQHKNFTFWGSIYFANLSEPRPDDIEYVIGEYDRIDLLSQKFYGTPRLWWVIAVVNNIYNISTEFHPKRKIRIPSNDFIDSLFIRT